MTEADLLGDLRERADGSFGGWCWAPDRPSERLVVDLLVNDGVAASIVAAVFRRDLQARGIGDGRHGFHLRLPPNIAAAAGEYFVTARERSSGRIFGRLLCGSAAAAGPPGGERLQQAGAQVEALWRRLETLRGQRPAHSPDRRLLAACGALAARLDHRAAGRIARTGPPIVLGEVPTPLLSLVLPVDQAAATRQRLRALAPAAGPASAEFVALDAGADSAAALLPSQVRGLRYRHDPAATTAATAANLASDLARGRWLVLLAPPAVPSAAALLALARALAAHVPALLLGGIARDAALRRALPAGTVARLPARLGVTLCVHRSLWQALGPLDTTLAEGTGAAFADFALRAAVVGAPVLGLAEPAAPDAAEYIATATPAQNRLAEAALRDRWGVPA